MLDVSGSSCRSDVGRAGILCGGVVMVRDNVVKVNIKVQVTERFLEDLAALPEDAREEVMAIVQSMADGTFDPLDGEPISEEEAAIVAEMDMGKTMDWEGS